MQFCLTFKIAKRGGVQIWVLLPRSLSRVPAVRVRIWAFNRMNDLGSLEFISSLMLHVFITGRLKRCVWSEMAPDAGGGGQRITTSDVSYCIPRIAYQGHSGCGSLRECRYVRCHRSWEPESSARKGAHGCDRPLSDHKAHGRHLQFPPMAMGKI